MNPEIWKRECVELFRLVTREEWGAAPAKWEMPQQTGPQGIFYTTCARTCWCKEDDDCKVVVKNLQQKHFDQGHPDIQFNFLIGADGNIYEGAGWNNIVCDLIRPLANPHPKIVIGTLGKPTETRYMRRLLRARDRFMTYAAEKKYFKCGEKHKMDMFV